MPTEQPPITEEMNRLYSLIADQVYDEFITGRRNADLEDGEFEAVLDMLECKRSDKEYDWMSDVFLPEYPSIFLTEASQWVNQYFQSRDFVSVILEDGTTNGKQRADAAKKVINATLNHRRLFHYQKYVRARSINSTRGCVYAVCWWDQSISQVLVGYRSKPVPDTVDIYGNEIVDPNVQTPRVTYEREPVHRDKVEYDHFNYDVIDPRNVATDNTYVYSIQQKEWVVIRSEATYEQLMEMQPTHGYFNLDKVKALMPPDKTEYARDTVDKDDNALRPTRRVSKPFDTLERFGKLWAIEDPQGNLTPGIKEDGSILPGAQYLEAIFTEVYVGSTKVPIRFQRTPFITKSGMTYRPIIRGLCYVHPTKDIGMNDGKYARELQMAINDTINMSNDRVKLATLPTFKGKRQSVEDNPDIYFEPEHIIPLENTDDLQEIVIRDNIRGAMEQTSLFISKLQQVESIYPTTMGNLPVQASTTATAVAGAESRTNLRSNYKSLTFEFTFLIDFYWMILNMFWQFVHPETAQTILGELGPFFDPEADYTYQPVSSNIETEYNKQNKVKMWDQVLGRITAIPNPAIVPVVSHILSRICELMGDEVNEVAPMLRALAQTPNQPEAGAESSSGGSPPSSAAPQTQPGLTSNQYGRPVLPGMMGVRNTRGDMGP